jgi:hypothetical protein
MTSFTKLVPGGEVRMVKKGDKSTFKGEVKEAQKDYIMLKLVSMKTPIFIDKTAAHIIDGIFNDSDFLRMYQWFKIKD